MVPSGSKAGTPQQPVAEEYCRLYHNGAGNTIPFLQSGAASYQHLEVTASAPVQGRGALPGPEMTGIVSILKPP